MLPAALTPESEYRQKQLAYEQLETSSHWPCKEEWFAPRKDTQFTVRPYFKTLPELTPRQRLLYGLERYSSVSLGPSLQQYNATSGDGYSTATAAATQQQPNSAPSKSRRWGSGRGSCASVIISEMHNSGEGNGRNTTESQMPEFRPASLVPVQQEPSNSNARPAKVDCYPSTSDFSDASKSVEFKDTRRLNKALREISNLEDRLAKGERLHANQIQKIERKNEYLQVLERMASTTIPRGE